MTQTFLPRAARGPLVGTGPPIPLIAASTAAVAAAGAVPSPEAPAGEAEESAAGDEQAAVPSTPAAATASAVRRREVELRFMIDRPLSLVTEVSCSAAPVAVRLRPAALRGMCAARWTGVWDAVDLPD